MNRKILFLDIDGTLTEPGVNTPPASAMEAIKKARENNHLVFLCTGRNYGMFKCIYDLGFDGAIGSNGGFIIYKDEILFDHPMSEEDKKLVMDTFLESGIYRTIECRETAYTDEAFKEFLSANANEGSNSELLRWRYAVEKSLNMQPMALYKNEPIYKLVFMSRSMDFLDTPKKVLGERFNIVIQEPDPFGITNGELVPKDFDKGQAVLKVCDYFGIDVADSIGFGDSMNDIEMIQTVGYSVVMSNGAAALKEKADYIAPAVTEDGMYKAFSDLGLID